jgi:hypothetical protein
MASLKAGTARKALGTLAPPSPADAADKKKKKKKDEEEELDDGSADFVQAQEPTSVTGKN